MSIFVKPVIQKKSRRPFFFKSKRKILRMSEKTIYSIPKDIEQAVPIMGAHPVDLSFSVMMFSFGLIVKSMLLSLGLMIVFLYLLSKLRKGVKRGYSQHYMWRIGVTSMDAQLSKKFPDPSVNDFIN